jgi:hypothetical protein
MDLLPDIPPLPPPFDIDQHYGLNVDLQMFGNDSSNDCVIAARAHHTIRLVWVRSRSQVNISPGDVDIEYHKETGTNNSTDGLDLGTSLKEWQGDGWTYGDDPVNPKLMHRIQKLFGPYSIDGGTLPVDNPVDVLNPEKLQGGICSSVGAQVNLILPSSVKFTNKGSFGPHNPWTDTIDSSGDEHVVLLTGYDVKADVDSFSGITWAQKQSMTWAFLQTHCWGVFFLEGGDTT